MPYTIRKMPNRECYRVRNLDTGRVMSSCTTRAKAEAQVRLLNAIDHGYVPRRRKN